MRPHSQNLKSSNDSDDLGDLDELKDVIEPLLSKTISKKEVLENRLSNHLQMDVMRSKSKSVTHNAFVKRFKATEAYKDVQESLLSQSRSKVDRVKKFYRYSGGEGYNVPDEDDIEALPVRNFEHNVNRHTLHEDEAAGNLYILNKLVYELGFPVQMCKYVLLYDKDTINDDINKAVELLLKTEEGWLHTFVPESDYKYTSKGSELYNSPTEDMKEK
jgi:hypothetical protein